MPDPVDLIGTYSNSGGKGLLFLTLIAIYDKNDKISLFLNVNSLLLDKTVQSFAGQATGQTLKHRGFVKEEL